MWTQLAWDSSPRSPFVGVIRLHNVAKRNALDGAGLRDFRSAVAQAARAGSRCRAVVLAGDGGFFSAGADLDWLTGEAARGAVAARKAAALIHAALADFSRLSVPKIAAIRGGAFGLGVGLAACADFAVADDRARFRLSETRLGVVGSPLLEHLRGRLRPGDWNRWVLTGAAVSAEEARAAGLLAAVFPANLFWKRLTGELEGVLAGHAQSQQAFLRNRSKPAKTAAAAIAPLALSLRSEGFRAASVALRAGGPAPWSLGVPPGWAFVRPQIERGKRT